MFEQFDELTQVSTSPEDILCKSCMYIIDLWKSRDVSIQFNLVMICENHYQGSKIRITLFIEYLKTITLFEIRFTPQTKSITSSLNDSCWSIISMQEHLCWDSNHSTSKINHVELEWFYLQPKLHRIAK